MNFIAQPTVSPSLFDDHETAVALLGNAEGGIPVIYKVGMANTLSAEWSYYNEVSGCSWIEKCLRWRGGQRMAC